VTASLLMCYFNQPHGSVVMSLVESVHMFVCCVTGLVIYQSHWVKFKVTRAKAVSYVAVVKLKI